MIFMSGNIIRMGMTGEALEKIPAGYWLINYNDMTGFYLERMKEFDIPERIYGNIEKRTDKVVNSFNRWDGNLGVLMSGYKGTGKTLLAKNICRKCVEDGLPVLCMTNNFGGTDFISFLNEIDQPCVMLIDEFEKIFKVKNEDDGGAQYSMLGLLDGAIKSKFLFLLTINEESKMSQFLFNRPGRIHYKWDFKGMPDEMIEEVAEANLDDKGRINDILKISTFVGEMSMDILLSIIREVNEYPEQSIKELLEDMNLQQDSSSYKISLCLDGELYATFMDYGDNSPYDDDIYLEWYSHQIKSKFLKDKGGNMRSLTAYRDRDKQAELNKEIHDSIENRNGPTYMLTITELSFSRKDADIYKDDRGRIHFVVKEEMQTHEGFREVEWDAAFEKSKDGVKYMHLL